MVWIKSKSKDRWEVSGISKKEAFSGITVVPGQEVHVAPVANIRFSPCV